MLCFQIVWLEFAVPILGMKLFHFPKVTLTYLTSVSPSIHRLSHLDFVSCIQRLPCQGFNVFLGLVHFLFYVDSPVLFDHVCIHFLPFFFSLPQVISLMCFTCVLMLLRPLVYIRQTFLPLVASFSGHHEAMFQPFLSEWFSVFWSLFLVFWVVRCCLLIPSFLQHCVHLPLSSWHIKKNEVISTCLAVPGHQLVHMLTSCYCL